MSVPVHHHSLMSQAAPSLESLVLLFLSVHRLFSATPTDSYQNGVQQTKSLTHFCVSLSSLLAQSPASCVKLFQQGTSATRCSMYILHTIFETIYCTTVISGLRWFLGFWVFFVHIVANPREGRGLLLSQGVLWNLKRLSSAHNSAWLIDW